ncbi:MAG TPA: hypothetical protein VFR95_01460 [Gemmatimonadaceae bacterium]|nr:hypothetical protein [Gemmatimonadaceae bacterium]
MTDRAIGDPPVPTTPTSGQRSPDSSELRERAQSIWKRIVHAVTWRFPVKFSALALAFSLWVMVSTQEQTEAWVNVKVQIVTDSSVTLVSELPEVQALVGGRGRELLKLYTSGPAIRRVVGPDTPDEITLDLRPGDVIIPGNADVRVRDVTPRSLTLDFEVTEQRYLPVRALVRLSVDSGMRVTNGPRVLPGSVLVKGPRRAVRGLGSVTTDRVNIVVHDSEIVRSVKVDTTGLGLTQVTPSEVRIQITAERIPPPRPAPLDTTPSGGALASDTADTALTRSAPGSITADSGVSDSSASSAARDSGASSAGVDSAASSSAVDSGASSDSTETRR